MLDLLEKVREYAKQNGVPIIREKTAGLLFALVKEKKPTSILEIGTAIGYSGSVFLLANEKARLTTIDVDKKRLEYAQSLFSSLSLSKRAEIIEGDALLALSNLARQEKKFDFIFLDGPKAQYYKYLPLVENLLVSGSMLICDNIYFNSSLPRHSHIVKKLSLFRNMLASNKDLETEFLGLDDGLSISYTI